MNNAATPEIPAAVTSPPPLQGYARVLTAILVAFSSFMVTLDASICNVSIPTIASGIGVSPHEGTWVITSYAVADAITVPLAGWLTARFGPGRTVVFAMIGFGISSALCGLSTTLAMLVTARVLQGLMGGPLIPLSQAILLTIFPKDKAGMALALWTMTGTAGPICGTLLGGYICDNWSWPWIFLVNVPVTAIISALIWRLLRHRDAPPQRRPIDYTGFALMVVWIGAVQIMLDRGQDLDWFGSSLIVGLLIVAVIGFAAFMIWELTDSDPVVNLRVFRNRGFVIAAGSIVLGFGAFFGSTVLSPLWLQTNMGYTPTWAAMTAAISGVTGVLMSPVVGWMIGKTDVRKIIFCGLAGMAAAYAWRGHFASNASFELVVLTQFAIGTGVTLFYAPAMTLALGSVKQQEVPGAAGLISFTRTASMAFATALTTTEWQNAASRNRLGIVDRFSGANALDQMSAIGLSPDQMRQHLDNIVQNQAVMMATNDTYFMFAAAVALGALCVWFAPRPRPKTAAG